MAKIQQVDYKSMASYAKTIRSNGKNFNTKMTSVYTNIKNLHTYWYGQRYNSLAKSFNEMLSNVNSMSTLVCYEIPYALETIANNYSQADQGTNITSADSSKPTAITSITIKNDTGMKFITSNVESTQNTVNSLFKSALSYLDTIDANFKKIKNTWSSEAADAFQKKFNTLKSSLTSSVTQVQTNFKTLVDAAKSDVQNAETKNTVS